MAERHFLMLSAIGPDRPGLVAELSAFVVERGGNVENSRATIADIVRIHGANIVDLETSTSSAPMSGEALFD